MRTPGKCRRAELILGKAPRTPRSANWKKKPALHGTLSMWSHVRLENFFMIFRRQCTDDDVNIATRHQEFRAWRWVEPDQLEGLIVPFKRELYRNVVAEFTPHF